MTNLNLRYMSLTSGINTVLFNPNRQSSILIMNVSSEFLAKVFWHAVPFCCCIAMIFNCEIEIHTYHIVFSMNATVMYVMMTVVIIRYTSPPTEADNDTDRAIQLTIFKRCP